jgi:L-fuconolactonase
LFEGGIRGSFVGRPGVQIDEAACYGSLARDHGVKAALIVGYAGTDWCAQNNAFLARTTPDLDWARPAAYVDPTQPLSTAQLDQFAQEGFVGLVFYLASEDQTQALSRMSNDIWSWLVQHRWLVSVNSGGQHLNCWPPLLNKHSELRLVLSHLGAPPRVQSSLSAPDAKRALAEVLALAPFPGPRVKLSGFYAVSDPPYDYPHERTWPYVETLLDAYGAERLLWGSDFSPALDALSFPQTFGLFAKMPFLSDRDRAKIEGENLLGLLEEVETG